MSDLLFQVTVESVREYEYDSGGDQHRGGWRVAYGTVTVGRRDGVADSGTRVDFVSFFFH